MRCTRCDRPICPDCMVPAAVGFQCPECVAQGRAEVRQPHTVAGGRVVDRPWVTYVLVAVCAGVFLIQSVVGISATSADYGMWPFGVADGEVYRLLTSAFLHGSLLHILFNMYVLVVLGSPLERALGHVRYGVLYLLAALGGSVASYAFSDPRTVSVGASGAVFGLMGALAVAAPRLRFDYRQIIALVAINLVIGFVVSGIDWRAHLGGLVTGAAVGAVMVYAPTRGRLAWQTGGCLVVLGVLVLGWALRTQDLQVYFS